MKAVGMKIRVLCSIVMLLLILLPAGSDAATMNDYCVLPPFIVGGVTPNLLLMIDNSSSMYDLSFIDKGSAARTPYYCYDETYNKVNVYVGYFNPDDFYEYDFVTDNFFVSVEAFGCDNYLAGELCVNINTLATPNTVTRFVARGNYLNWLSASKFDIQKSILTGGKFADGTCSVSIATPCSADSQCPPGETCVGFLKAESRGCVGRKFIKEAITGDFVEYPDGSPDPNASLGVTFGVRGPDNPLNATALSPGGQTFIDIFKGDYQQGLCQDAIDLLADPAALKNDIIKAIDLCLNNAATNKKNCEFDTRFPKPICNADSPDCIEVGGTCLVASGGVCDITMNGICGMLPINTGVCSPNNGTDCSKVCVGGVNAGDSCNNNGQCPGGSCSAGKQCIGGGKAGAACNNVADCAFSSCSAPASKAGQACSANSECDVKTCTAGKPNTTTCAVNSDCDVKACTAGLIGNACTVNDDCNASYCNTGPFAPPALGGCAVDADCGAGRTCIAGFCAGQCSTDWECSKTYGHCLAPPTTQVKSTFTQSMHSCYQFTNKGQDVGSNEVQQVSNPSGCNQIFAQVKVCQGGSKDGLTCSVLADCPGAIACLGGPSTIRPGSPVLLCSSTFAGYCASNPNNDNWATTSWVPREFASADDCILAMYRKFCGDANVPPVVDPTDAPSDTTNYSNLPAIINDIGIEAQLNDPIDTLRVTVKSTSEPKTGLLQNFSGLIRMGAMTFNFNGTGTECNTICSHDAALSCTTDADCVTAGPAVDGKCISPVACPKLCSSDAGIQCSSYLDCPAGLFGPATCDIAPKLTTNLDGGKIVHYIGASTGDHSLGLIKAIDDIQAMSWTPFTEAFYNSIGYFARTNAYTATPATSRSDVRLNATDFDADKNPSQYRCQANNILMISDGMTTADRNTAVSDLASLYNDGDGQTTPSTAASTECPQFAGSRNLDDLAWLAKNTNIKTFPVNSGLVTAPANLSEFITTYVVYTGVDDPANPGECNSKTLMDQTAVNGGTTLFNPQNPEQLRSDLTAALQNITAKSASGTAASVLASGEGSGANIVQAIFYPERKVGLDRVTWSGILQNLWYYNDPFQQSSTIREDTDGDRLLKLTQDNIVSYFFNPVTNETMVNLFRDTDGDGDADAAAVPPQVAFDNMDHLWEAGKSLFNTTAGALNTTIGGRKIYTNINGDSVLDAFDGTSIAALQPLLNVNVNVPDDAVHTQTQRLISYARGYDTALTIDNVATRKRTLTLGGVTNTWKLGDIVNSTPRVMTRYNTNDYHNRYGDSTYQNFIQSDAYKSRAVVFAGGNDGMLHAFDMGLLGVYNVLDKKASIGKYCSTTTSLPCSSNADCPSAENCLTDVNMGKEIWGFIPKNALPYLKYFADEGYCHVYSIDATPYFVDVSTAIDTSVEAGQTGNCTNSAYANYWECNRTKDSWRTVLIGSMRLGGACRNIASTCGDCVKTPVNNLGFSTYFALDVTDPASPKLMWEFTNQDLGMSTTGPAVVRIEEKSCSLSTATKCTVDSDCPALESCSHPPSTRNGRWFAVLGAGPTGYVSPATHQFTGVGPQTDADGLNLHANSPKLFVLDIATGNLQATLRPDAEFYSGYYGSLVNASSDMDLDYSDDAIYFGFTRTNRFGPDFFDSVGFANMESLTLASLNELNFKDAVLSPVDDIYKGKFIELVDSTGRWMTRMITAYNGTTKVMTLDSPLPTNQLSDSWYVFPGWNKGGVMRLVTRNNMNPNQWALSPLIYDSDFPASNDIGPVSATVSKLLNESKGELRLYFGSGRYFYKVNEIIDDASSGRRLFGIKDPCYTLVGDKGFFDPYCTSSVSFSEIGNADLASKIVADVCTPDINVTDDDGWYIDMDSCTDASGDAIACTDPLVVYRTERMVTNPLALNIGVVFFTTTKPSADMCSYGGLTHLYAVRFDTGGCVPDGILKGKAIMQLSTGAIKEIDLKDAFTEKGKIRPPFFQGQPPEGQGLSVSVPPKPMDTILHIRKK